MVRFPRIARLDLDQDLQLAGPLESQIEWHPLSPLERLLEADDHEVRTAWSQRETLPRKVWTDCVRCPRRHACDETAVVLDLVPGASEAARTSGRSWVLPIPPPAVPETSLPIIVS